MHKCQCISDHIQQRSVQKIYKQSKQQYFYEYIHFFKKTTINCLITWSH